MIWTFRYSQSFLDVYKDQETWRRKAVKNKVLMIKSDIDPTLRGVPRSKNRFHYPFLGGKWAIVAKLLKPQMLEFETLQIQN